MILLGKIEVTSIDFGNTGRERKLQEAINRKPLRPHVLSILHSKLLIRGSELFIHTFLTDFLLKPSHSLRLKKFSASATFDLTSGFSFKQLQPSFNLRFNLRITLGLQSSSQQCPSLLQALVSKNLQKNTLRLTIRVYFHR